MYTSVKFKPHGQKIVKSELAVCKDNGKIIIAEFAHDLQTRPAGTAWMREIALRTAYYRDCFEFCTPLGYRFENGCALGTYRQRKRAVLDIAAFEYSAVFSKQRRANGESRIL